MPTAWSLLVRNASYWREMALVPVGNSTTATRHFVETISATARCTEVALRPNNLEDYFFPRRQARRLEATALATISYCLQGAAQCSTTGIWVKEPKRCAFRHYRRGDGQRADCHLAHDQSTKSRMKKARH